MDVDPLPVVPALVFPKLPVPVLLVSPDALIFLFSVCMVSIMP